MLLRKTNLYCIACWSVVREREGMLYIATAWILSSRRGRVQCLLYNSRQTVHPYHREWSMGMEVEQVFVASAFV
jgi:hypothetical protein